MNLEEMNDEQIEAEALKQGYNPNYDGENKKTPKEFLEVAFNHQHVLKERNEKLSKQIEEMSEKFSNLQSTTKKLVDDIETQKKKAVEKAIKQLEAEEMKRLDKRIPSFSAGDTVIVSVNVVEGERKRLQAYEGVVIAKRNRGLNSSFIVRKISSGEGVERTFQTYSPLIASIEVKRRGDVARAKLYYLRQRTGKSARIREKLTTSNEEVEQASTQE